MEKMPVALVTGANQGIGLQIAKDLHANNFVVLVGSRDFAQGEAAAVEIGPNAVAVQLDVTDRTSIASAAERVRGDFGRLDVLVQNAAIATAGTGDLTGEALADANRPSTVPIENVRTVWDTNVFGVLAVFQAMVPILRATPGARVVNISSGAGSLTLNSDPHFPLRPIFDASYAASKAALNALTLAMAVELEADGVKVHAVSPGFTKTRLTAFSGTDTVEQGAAEAVRVALYSEQIPTGSFTHATQGNLPW
jgi:NAD(P)-dependent dehydrogenase (short-subunit alcohol dehydrogenase family)